MTTKISLLDQVQDFYIGTQADIEALTGVRQGSIGYATDRGANQHLGIFNGATWEWDAGSGASIWGGITGTLSSQTDLQAELDGKVSHSLNTAVNDFLVGTGTGGPWIKRTLNQTAGILQTIFNSVYAPLANGVTNGDSHNHVGGDGAALNYTDVIGAFFNGVSIPAGTTYYGCPYKIGVDGTSNQFPWPEGGVLSDLSIRISAAQPGTGTLVATLFVNGVATALVVTIAAGAAAGTYSDTTHTVTIAATNTLRWDIVNNASSGSANLTAASMKLTKQTT